jgi:hypothetical protein
MSNIDTLIDEADRKSDMRLVQKFAFHIAGAGLNDDDLVTVRESKDTLQHCLEEK